jgi:MOSC domain-containing protein YiiM
MPPYPVVLGRVRAVLTGRARPYTRPNTASAIDKAPREGRVAVGEAGLAGDEQGDPRVHGGPEKAILCYAWAHYAAWAEELGGHPLLAAPGAFGENLSLDGLAEDSVCLGDEWRVGTARVVVSQGRQPCWKLDDRFGVPGMARRVQESGRAGFYLRVVEAGDVGAGDAMELSARPHPTWPLARLFAMIRDRDLRPELLREALALPLAESWRKLFARRLESGGVEDWTSRLDGPR